VIARAVFFDIGETLVNGPSRGPASRIARQLGLPRERKRTLHHALMTTPFESPREVAAWLGVSGAERAVAGVWAAQEDDARPVPGAAETLRALHDDGVTIGLISNIWQPYLTSTRKHFGELFDELVPRELQLFSFQVGVAKPSPAIFQQALRAAGVDPADAVMVGDDRTKDIAPAAALGMRTIQTNGGALAHPVG
jgi:HAD superfamily hydrolase (TIGR01509 family)